jgi:hypothetical protein
MRFSFLIFIFNIFLSCSNAGVPGDVLPLEKMQPILFDLLRADEYVNNFVLRDTLLKREKEAVKLYEQVFSIHKVTSAEFYKSYKYYQAHPDKNKVLLDSLNSLVNRKKGITDSANNLNNKLKNAL